MPQGSSLDTRLRELAREACLACTLPACGLDHSHEHALESIRTAYAAGRDVGLEEAEAKMRAVEADIEAQAATAQPGIREGMEETATTYGHGADLLRALRTEETT